MNNITVRERIALAFGVIALAVAALTGTHADTVAQRAASAANCRNAKGDTVLGCVTQVIRFGAVVDNAGSITISHTTGDMDLASHLVHSMAAPVAPGDGVNLSTIDTRLIMVVAKTTQALAANTYANGSSGVGATITENANGALGTIDGVTPAVGDGVLNQSDPTGVANGPYVVTSAGSAGSAWVLTRHTSCDQAAELKTCKVRVVGGVQGAGSEYAFRGYRASYTIGTDGLPFWPSIAKRITPNEYVSLFDDMTWGGSNTVTATLLPNGWTSLLTGAASAITPTGATGRTDVLWNPRTAAGSSGFLSAGVGNITLDSLTGFHFDFRVMTPVVCDATNDCKLMIGIADSTTIPPTNGVVLNYQRGVSTTNWQMTACAASSCTNANAGTLAATTFTRQVIHKDPFDTNVYVQSDGGSITTLSGLPASSAALQLLINTTTTAGVITTRGLQVDWISEEIFHPNGVAN